MTTIACDGRTMAGDGRVTADKTFLLTDRFRKVVLLGDGRVFGGAGDMASIVNAIDWLNDGAPGGDDRPEVDKDSFEGLVLARDRTLFWFDDHCIFVPYEPPYAIGVGAEIAMALMRRGASPREAVKAAADNHVTVGGLITELRPRRR